jgi:type II secretory pathway component PulF
VVSVTVRPLLPRAFASPAQWIRAVLTQSITFTQLIFGFASKAMEKVQNATHLANWMLRFFVLCALVPVYQSTRHGILENLKIFSNTTARTANFSFYLAL